MIADAATVPTSIPSTVTRPEDEKEEREVDTVMSTAERGMVTPTRAARASTAMAVSYRAVAERSTASTAAAVCLGRFRSESGQTAHPRREHVLVEMMLRAEPLRPSSSAPLTHKTKGGGGGQMALTAPPIAFPHPLPAAVANSSASVPSDATALARDMVGERLAPSPRQQGALKKGCRHTRSPTCEVSHKSSVGSSGGYLSVYGL